MIICTAQIKVYGGNVNTAMSGKQQYITDQVELNVQSALMLREVI
jgi:hypothetical protein|tara:strand:- start:242 stop:376 length:135 start_codon:yes stop_codon:yes gene_type:complete